MLTVGAGRDERIVGDHVGRASLPVHLLEHVQRQLPAACLLASRNQAAVGNDVPLAATRHHVLCRREKQKIGQRNGLTDQAANKLKITELQSQIYTPCNPPVTS